MKWHIFLNLKQKSARKEIKVENSIGGIQLLAILQGANWPIFVALSSCREKSLLTISGFLFCHFRDTLTLTQKHFAT